MTRIRIDFCDFWPGFIKTDNPFMDLLSKRFEVVLADKPDFIFYADFGHHHRLYTCPRIFFSGEKSGPNFSECDYAFTSHYIDDSRHYRLPLYVLYTGPEPLIKKPGEEEEVLRAPRKFCSFIVSNAKAKERIEFFQRLNARKGVDSGGRHLNNIGGPVENKATWLTSYRFNIAFENRSQPGYTTEKILEAMRARCIPIYWGNPLIAKEFNPKSFLNYFDFPNEDALIERILEIEGNEALYRQYLREPFFYDNKPNEYFDLERLLDRFEELFTAKIDPVGQRRSLLQMGRWIMAKKDHPKRA